jgi:hypothetical protein
VPGRDQELAGDRGLRGVLAVARRDPQVVSCQGLDGRQAWLAASTAAQRSVREPALERAPVAERSPDWLTLGARPA